MYDDLSFYWCYLHQFSVVHSGMLNCKYKHDALDPVIWAVLHVAKMGYLYGVLYWTIIQHVQEGWIAAVGS